MDNSTSIINFDTPYEYLPPAEAYQTAVSAYLQIAALGALVWDTVDHLPFDLKLLFTNRFSFNAFAYFGSRIGTLGYVISSSTFGTSPTGNCARFEKIDDAFYPISIGCSSLLFFLRLRAIYNDNRAVVAFFFLLWCGLAVSAIFIPISVNGTSMDPQGLYCTDANVPLAAIVSIFAPLVNDTLVFLAISWRLATVVPLTSPLQNVKAALFGTYLPVFTRSLLLDGQRYYLISLISNLVTVILASVTSIPIELRYMSITPNVALVSIMACRVYRRTKMGILRESEISTKALAAEKSTKIVFASVPTRIPPTGASTGQAVSDFTNYSSAHHIDMTLPANGTDDESSSQDGTRIFTKIPRDVEKGI